MLFRSPVYDIFSNPKTAITREFVASGSSLQKVEELIEHKAPLVTVTAPEQLVKLTYDNESADEALVSEASRRFGVNVSIVAAHVEVLQDLPLGSLVARISGQDKQVEQAIEYFADCGVQVEVLSNGRD